MDTSMFESESVIEFIYRYYSHNPAQLAFQYHGKVDFDLAAVCSQIELWQKGVAKIPHFCNERLLFTRKTYEQCTSQAVAQFKASLFGGHNLIDATGGAGVDSYYIGKKFRHVTILETDPQKEKLLSHNFKKLAPPFDYKIICDNAISYLENYSGVDVVYIDPDRRDTNNKRKILLEDCSPDIMQIVKNDKIKYRQLAIKLSPLLDISYIIKKVGPDFIYCISEKNELKEILVVKTQTPSSGNPVIIAVDITNGKIKSYSDKLAPNQELSIMPEYFYENGPSIIKAGLCHSYFRYNNIVPQNTNATFGTSEVMCDNFIGRRFKIIMQKTFNTKKIAALLEAHKIKKANITTRNFIFTPVELKKKFNLDDGGEYYLFFTTDEQGQKIFFMTKEISRL